MKGDTNDRKVIVSQRLSVHFWRIDNLWLKMTPVHQSWKQGPVCVWALLMYTELLPEIL